MSENSKFFITNIQGCELLPCPLHALNCRFLRSNIPQFKKWCRRQSEGDGGRVGKRTDRNSMHGAIFSQSAGMK